MRVRCLSLSLIRLPSRWGVHQPRRSTHDSRPNPANPSRASRLSHTNPSPTNLDRLNDRSNPNTASLLALLRRNPELSHLEATNELRWIQQSSKSDTDTERSCARRGDGEPLQYILGDVDFGPLTLLTRAPVLIPRPETAFVITRLAGLINSSLINSTSSSSTSLSTSPTSTSPSPSSSTSTSPSTSSSTSTPPSTSSTSSTSISTTTRTTTSTSSPGKISHRLKIADLCSGSGCIALLLSHLIRPRPIVRGYDISQSAISLSRENAQRLSSSYSSSTANLTSHSKSDSNFNSKFNSTSNSNSNPTSHSNSKAESNFNSNFKTISNSKVNSDSDFDSAPDITFTQLDLFHPQAIEVVKRGYGYDLIVSNPPYITWKEYHALPHSVKAYEDPRALLGDLGVTSSSHSRGLAFYQRIAAMLPDLLNTDSNDTYTRRLEYPRVALEIGEEQAQDVQSILLASRCVQRTEVWQDQYGKDRMVVGWTK
ncbi:S-adenosyl-L-methionine-dependent methyltransferase [Naematelia encephala]|uniref:S-adenosyl-L-methionine-dependent methyltransferase n=1 Tax=Naematelia encephala TaxID=71784 RepID=A0A1Y2AIT2_9TREE|nr:S-adenosyl-L-methionine-dependent methyltransferase [Naematelia encephala]